MRCPRPLFGRVTWFPRATLPSLWEPARGSGVIMALQAQMNCHPSTKRNCHVHFQLEAQKQKLRPCSTQHHRQSSASSWIWGSSDPATWLASETFFRWPGKGSSTPADLKAMPQNRGASAGLGIDVFQLSKVKRILHVRRFALLFVDSVSDLQTCHRRR